MSARTGTKQSPATVAARLATQRANQLRRPTSRAGVGFTGVERRSSKCFVAVDHAGGKRTKIGSFPTARLAAAARADWLLAPLAGDDSHQPERTDQ